MPISNVTVQHTYDEWRTITNQLINFVNEIDGQQLINVSSNSAVLTVTPRVARNERLFISLNVSSSLSDRSTLNLATANAVSVVYSDLANTTFIANSAYAAANAANSYAQTALETITNLVVDSGNFSTLAYVQANTARYHANLAYAQGNAAFIHAASSYIQANTVFQYANLIFERANTGGGGAQTAFTHANGAFLQANTARVHANISFDAANAAFIQANTARTRANTGYDIAAAGIEQANTGRVHANQAFAQANTARIHANGAWTHANAAFDYANSAVQNILSATFVGTANNTIYLNGKSETQFLASANSWANTKLANTSGMSFAGNLQFPTGNIAIGTGAHQGIPLYIAKRDANANIAPDIATFGGTQSIRLNSNTSLGAWNDLTSDRDATIIFSRGNFDDGANLVIGPWTDSSYGYKQDGEGRHGFNTINPRYTIDANGTVNVSTTLIVAGQDIPTVLNLSAGTANLAFVAANQAFMRANNANLAIFNDGVNATRYVMFTEQTSGNIARVNISSTALTFNPFTATLTATHFNSLSDESRKDEITKITDAVNLVNQLNGVRFVWKDTGQPSAGIIAQDLQKIMPELVGADMSVTYSGIIGLLVEAIKELNERIKTLEGK